MVELKKLNEDLSFFLNQISPILIEEIKQIYLSKSLNLIDNKESKDIVYYNFEYLHDFLNIEFFYTDKEGFVISEMKDMLSKKIKSNSFLPIEIWNKLNDIEYNFQIDDWLAILEVYEAEKDGIFRDWFINCWSKAIQYAPNSIPTYFSTKEFDTGIELHSMDIVEINKEQPNQRRYFE